MNKLIEILKKDCEEWVSKKEKRLFMNERDMQVRLAMYLKKTNNYDQVYVEYLVPLEMLGKQGLTVPQCENRKWIMPNNCNFPWHNQMRIDIMVEKGGKFAAVELKYATTLVDEPLQIFGEQPTGKNCEVIKYQGAQDLVMYGYWKDVRRIEALTSFKNMVGGVALIVSNDKVYWAAPKQKAGYRQFSTHEKNTVGSGKLEWEKNISAEIKKTNPAFRLDGSYACAWSNTAITARARNTRNAKSDDDTKFRYMINVVEK